MLRRIFALPAISLLLSMLVATDAGAFAGAQRTFVASTGSDANSCTLIAPCRSFATAISFTAYGGEVIVLDSAGYGPVAIAQSVSIIAPPGIYGGISVPGSGTGVAITAAGIKVLLRGLSINSTGGDYGIRMTNGAELNVENCTISNFSLSGNRSISIETAARVAISGTIIRDSYFGIIVGFGATANIANSQLLNNNAEGVEIFGGPPATTLVFIADTLVTGTGAAAFTDCIDNYTSAGAIGHIYATRVTVTGCYWGIINEPQGAGTTTVSFSMVTGNHFGILNVTGTTYSTGNNHVNGNVTDLSSVTTIGTF